MSEVDVLRVIVEEFTKPDEDDGVPFCAVCEHIKPRHNAGCVVLHALKVLHNLDAGVPVDRGEFMQALRNVAGWAVEVWEIPYGDGLTNEACILCESFREKTGGCPACRAFEMVDEYESRKLKELDERFPDWEVAIFRSAESGKEGV